MKNVYPSEMGCESEPKYTFYLIIILLILSLSIIVFSNIDYQKMYINEGIVISENKLKIYCNKNDLDRIINNKKIIINRKTFAYKNIVINDIVFNNNYYFEVLIDVDLDFTENIKNSIINFKIPLEKMTILKYIVEKIGGVK